MSRLTDAFSDIADAIRNKNGSSDTYTPEQMPNAINAIPTGGGTYQSKSVSPTESAQTVTADSGYDALSSVSVGAISSTYVGSGIARKSSSDLTASGATVTVPAGYYSSQATKSVSSGSATAPASISGSSATVSTGTNALTLTKTVSVTPSVSAGYVSAGTAGNSSVSLTASVTTKAAATITPGTTNQTIASGTYLTGTQTISGDANLVAGNIKSGTSIFGVTGTYSGGGSNPLKFGVLRPDAELIKTFSYDKYIVEDEKVTLPAYKTTAQTLKASETLTETVATDLTTYNYYILIRMLTIPKYNTNAIAKGRFEWIGSSCLYELCSLDENTIHSLSDPTKYATSRTSSMVSGIFNRAGYWSSTSTFTTYPQASYGCYQMATAPSFAPNKITLRTPVLYMRGSTTYYTQTYWEATTDIRYQWKIEVYRVPKTGDLNGEWGLVSQWRHVMNDVYSNSQTLT